MRLNALWRSVAALAGSVLLCLVVIYSFGAYLAETSPKLALKLDPGNPIALRNVAEQLVRTIELSEQKDETPGTPEGSAARVLRFTAPAELASGAPPNPTSQAEQAAAPLSSETKQEMLTQARQMIEAAIRNEPLDYRSLTLLAKIVEMQTPAETEAALPYYSMAARLSPRASEAIYWLLRRNIEKANYAEAVAQADTLLRTISRARPLVIPMLVSLAEKPEAASYVQSLLETDPPWREFFFATAHNTITDARTPLTLLLTLKDGAHPPREEELKGYLRFLMARGFYELSYYAWLQFLPSERLASAGLLFNGRFEDPPSGFPFDWNISAGAGTAVEFLPHPDEAGKRALSVEFSLGRVQFGGVTESVLIPPGRYVLYGRRKGKIEGRRGLRWRVYCLGKQTRMLAETPMDLSPISHWEEFELAFEVPTTECPMQQVRLNLDARSSSEQLVRGRFWYSDLGIRRLDETATKSGD
ncbi:MAG: hypothetical protein AB7E81_03670 [Hyphomicrobiaceae bacterium]